MKNQHKPVLIFAQSARFLAQSATQAGYSVWVADCFGDEETLSVADRWSKIPPLINSNTSTLIHILLELSQGENCTLVCGSGIESCYGILDQLPDNLQLLGNSTQTIQAIKTPSVFFDLLTQLHIPYPTTQFKQPKNSENWLAKSASGLGGDHIKKLPSSLKTTDYYFQKQVHGISGSALFLTNGGDVQLISINKQLIANCNDTPFRLTGIDTPLSITDTHRRLLQTIITDINLATGLIGLNSLDFMISDQSQLLVLEINPRPSASAELIGSAITLFQHHFNACQGKLPQSPITDPTAKLSLRYCFADTDYRIPNNMIWPADCHDIPAENTVIYKNEPICSALLYRSEAEDHSIDSNLKMIKQHIVQQLIRVNALEK